MEEGVVLALRDVAQQNGLSWDNVGHFDGGEAAFAGFGQPLGIGDQHDLAAAGADFLHVADGLFEQRAGGGSWLWS